MTQATPATSFQQLWDELKTAALNAWQTLKGQAIAAEKAIVPVVEQDVFVVLGQFKGVAVDTILTLAGSAYSNLTGTQKNAITANTVYQAAIASGKKIALQDAQMFAQQAYQALVSTVTQPAPPSSN